MSECTQERNPCRAAIEMSEYGGFGEGTSSWDAIVTLKAIRPDDFSDYVTLSGKGEGRNRVDYNGDFFKEFKANLINYIKIWTFHYI